MITITLYGKPGCCLCDEAEAIVEDLANEYPLYFKKIDITGDPGLFETYRYLIPVVVINDTLKLESRISRSNVEAAIRQVYTKQ